MNSNGEHRGVDTADRFAEVERWFDAVVDLPAERREAYLLQHCPDGALRDAVCALLASAEASEGFMDGAEASATERLSPGSEVGGWQIERLLGHGGMGEVYAVRRSGRDFTQHGALKLLARLDSADARRRFAEERRILGRLQHPGIAHLIDGGEHRGLPYAVMEYVDGVALTTHARDRPLEHRVRLFLQVCAAVSHAHRHLIVHRDLKPGNILVDAEGRVKLLDFGIAKLLDAGASDAVTQAILATPGYCAPEQLRGEPVEAATDIYALGVILHELLTGQRLWQLSGMPLVQALERLSTAEPAPPSASVQGALQRRLRGDLDAIVGKTLRNEPEQRYRSVDALADDLNAWLDKRPVAARGGALWYRLGRTLRHYRWWASAAMALLLSIAVGVGGIAWQAREAAIERDAARREAERADAVRQYLMLMFRSAGEGQQGSAVSAKQVLDQAAERLEDEFSADPQAYAEVTIALAELYFSLDDYTGARPLLERLLAGDRSIGEEQQAMALHDLAQIEARNDQSAVAADRLKQAQAIWSKQQVVYRNELLMSRMLQAQLERMNGDPAAALATLQRTLPERIEFSGWQHRETGKLVNNLGIAHFQAGDYDLAIEFFLKASDIWRDLRLERSADALNTLNNWAAAELRAQRPAAAVELFTRALALRRELYPPSAALAALANNLGKTLIQSGRHAEALPLMREAVELGERYAGPNSLLAMSAQLGLIDVLALLGSASEADALLAALTPTLLAAYGDAHPLTALLDISRARVRMAEGDAAAALQGLDRAETLLTSLGPAGAGHLPALQRLRSQWLLASGTSPPSS